MCIIHQTFRNAAADRIRIAGKQLKISQIAAVWEDGTRKIAPDEWLPILLEKAQISRTDLNMILRNNADVWVMYTD